MQNTQLGFSALSYSDSKIPNSTIRSLYPSINSIKLTYQQLCQLSRAKPTNSLVQAIQPIASLNEVKQLNDIKLMKNTPGSQYVHALTKANDLVTVHSAYEYLKSIAQNISLPNGNASNIENCFIENNRDIKKPRVIKFEMKDKQILSAQQLYKNGCYDWIPYVIKSKTLNNVNTSFDDFMAHGNNNSEICLPKAHDALKDLPCYTNGSSSRTLQK